jgi:lipoate synthase
LIIEESRLNNLMDYEDDLDNEVDDIISQIKNQSKILKRTENVHPDLKKEDLENFVITNAGKIVNHSLEMVESLKTEVLAGADSKLIESVSELVKATTSAIDSLSKLKLSEDKIKAQKEITQMNINAKVIKDEEQAKGIMLSREEIIKALMSKQEPQKIIDV